MLRIWHFFTLLLVALGLVMGGAHVLELPVKMHYDAQMYAAVTSTLYKFYGLVGGPIQVVSALAAAVLAFLVRGRASFRLTLSGMLCLICSLALWFALVEPVNATWLHVINTAPESVPVMYERLRPRWEYGHLAAFVFWFCGFVLLLLSALKGLPESRIRD